jgi:hypothetical protein
MLVVTVLHLVVTVLHYMFRPICIDKIQQASKSKQTNTHARNNKIYEENRTEKHKWKRAKCDHVQKRAKTSEADSSGI